MDLLNLDQILTPEELVKNQEKVNVLVFKIFENSLHFSPIQHKVATMRLLQKPTPRYSEISSKLNISEDLVRLEWEEIALKLKQLGGIIEVNN